MSTICNCMTLLCKVIAQQYKKSYGLLTVTKAEFAFVCVHVYDDTERTNLCCMGEHS